MRFTWDENKAARNLVKHGVILVPCETHRPWLSLLLPLHLSRRRNPHYSVIVAIQTVRQVLHLAALILRANRKCLVRSATFDPQRQIAFHVRSVIGGVLFLLMLLVNKHIA